MSMRRGDPLWLPGWVEASMGTAPRSAVRNYLSEAIGKLGAANQVEAARIARDRGGL